MWGIYKSLWSFGSTEKRVVDSDSKLQKQNKLVWINLFTLKLYLKEFFSNACLFEAWYFAFKFIMRHMLEKLDQNNILQVIFPWEDDCVLWGNIAQVIFVCNAMMYLDNIGQMIFLWNAGILWDNIAQSFYLCNVVSRVLRKHSTWFFLMQCCLEPSGQH